MMFSIVSRESIEHRFHAFSKSHYTMKSVIITRKENAGRNILCILASGLVFCVAQHRRTLYPVGQAGYI